MKVDFSSVNDTEDYATIPEGVYLCQIADVRTGQTRDGSPRWAIRLEVFDGDYAGRTAGWDSLSWTTNGMPRVKRVLSNLGFDVSGVLDIQATDLLGRQVRARFQIEEYEDPLTGNSVRRLRVPFLGYEAVEQQPAH